VIDAMAAVRTASSMAWAWSPAGNARAIVIALTIEASRVQASCCFSSGGAVHGGGEGGDDVSDPVLIRRAARVARTCHVRTERGHHTAVTGADAASASTPTAWKPLSLSVRLASRRIAALFSTPSMSDAALLSSLDSQIPKTPAK